MARAVAVALIALLAVAFAAEVSADFCRTSAYKVPEGTVVQNKKALWGACAKEANVAGGKVSTTKDGCTLIEQKVKNAAAWDAYSACEKKSDNAKAYGPLKAGSDACAKYQKKGDC